MLLRAGCPLISADVVCTFTAHPALLAVLVLLGCGRGAVWVRTYVCLDTLRANLSKMSAMPQETY